jgi:two-component system chemotaxis response regulator CheB
LKAIADAGGIVLVEDPAQAYADAMPIAAIKQCSTAHIMPLAGIADYLMKECQA